MIVEFTDYFVQDSSWFKLVVEYGYVAVMFFGLFFVLSLFRKSPDKVLSAACLVQFLFLGGYLLSFYVHFLYLVLVVWPELIEEEEPYWDEAENGSPYDIGEGVDHAIDERWDQPAPGGADDGLRPTSLS